MRAKEFSPNKLVIFDIDDTLVHTQTKVRVMRDGKVVKELNSHDFTHYKLQPGEEFDFENFRNAQEFFNNSKPIIPMMNQLKQDIATGNKVVMVTARADFDDRELFLDTFRKYGVDMGKVHVYRAGNMTQKVQTEEKKKIIIRNLLDKGNYTKAIMYDDAVPNLTSFVELKDEYANTKFYAWHVSLEGEASEFHRTNEVQSLEERKKKRRVRRAAYGPGPYGWYGYDAGYSGGDGGDGGGESIKHENFSEGQSIQLSPNMSVSPNQDPDSSEEWDYHYKGQQIKPGDKFHPQIKDLHLRQIDPTYDAVRTAFDNPITPGPAVPERQPQGDIIIPSRPVPSEKMKDLEGNPVKLKDYVPHDPKTLENFADGKNPQDKGDAKRHGVPTKASISTLRDVAKQGGRKGQLAHWMANMKAGRENK